MTQDRLNLLGVGVSVTNMEDTLSTIQTWLTGGTPHYVCCTGMHGLIASERVPALKQVYNRSGLTVPDGRPLFWLGRGAGLKKMGHVPGQELMLKVCELSQDKNYTHFFYGGSEGVAQELKAQLEKKYRKLKVVGTYTPPFRPLNKCEEDELIQLVKEKKPDIFWVGISTPKQDQFMADYISKLDTKIMFGVGAAFDVHSGRAPAVPPYIRWLGLEWLYRLALEPKRLWRRTAIDIPLFILKIVLQKTNLKQYKIYS